MDTLNQYSQDRHCKFCNITKVCKTINLHVLIRFALMDHHLAVLIILFSITISLPVETILYPSCINHEMFLLIRVHLNTVLRFQLMAHSPYLPVGTLHRDWKVVPLTDVRILKLEVLVIYKKGKVRMNGHR